MFHLNINGDLRLYHTLLLLSNVPPFISDETLVRIMSRYGKLVSPIKMIPIGCGSPLLKHVVSARLNCSGMISELQRVLLNLYGSGGILEKSK
uniref:Uncharacterized protein n=1 Tax=Cyprinus carpio carpio TaxID=630221 RepID=A0A9J8AI51_CYPCA